LIGLPRFEVRGHRSIWLVIDHLYSHVFGRDLMLLVAEPILAEDEKAASFETAFAEKHGAEDGVRAARRQQASDGGYGLVPLGRTERGSGA
jgi:hypothetical protein